MQIITVQVCVCFFRTFETFFSRIPFSTFAIVIVEPSAVCLRRTLFVVLQKQSDRAPALMSIHSINHPSIISNIVIL